MNVIYNVPRMSGKTTRLINILIGMSDEELEDTIVLIEKMTHKDDICKTCYEWGYDKLPEKINFISNLKNIRGNKFKNILIDDYFYIGTFNKKELMYYVDVANIIVFDTYIEYSQSFIDLVRARDVLMEDTFKHIHDLEYNIYFNEKFKIINSLD